MIFRRAFLNRNLLKRFIIKRDFVLGDLEKGLYYIHTSFFFFFLLRNRKKDFSQSKNFAYIHHDSRYFWIITAVSTIQENLGTSRYLYATRYFQVLHSKASILIQIESFRQKLTRGMIIKESLCTKWSI